LIKLLSGRTTSGSNPASLKYGLITAVSLIRIKPTLFQRQVISWVLKFLHVLLYV
jgi:hypothetical protein